MKKLKILVAVILLVAILAITTITMSSCNKQVFDFNYTFTTAVISWPDGTTKTIKLKSWTDYDGEQLQLKDEDGNVYLVSSFNCVLIGED